MEAMVWRTTGLLPEHLAVVGLKTLDNGSWQAFAQSDAGDGRAFEFAPEDGAEQRIADSLQAELGFSAYAAHETARRLFEPFALAADWS